MKIGIDIDGTITTPFYWLDFYNEHLGTKMKPKDITTYDHHLSFGISLKSFNTFRNNHIETIHNLALPRNEAARYVNQLFFEYQDIHIITAREKELEPLTKAWLYKYKLNYLSLHHLGSTEKLGTAIQLGLNVIIEDRLETAMEMIKWQIPTILFNTPYNEGLEHPLLYRVNTWAEAYLAIKDISKKIKKPETSSSFN